MIINIFGTQMMFFNMVHIYLLMHFFNRDRTNIRQSHAMSDGPTNREIMKDGCYNAAGL